MIILCNQEYKANRDLIEDLCDCYNGRVVPGNNGGQPAKAIIFQLNSQEDGFWADYQKGRKR